MDKELRVLIFEDSAADAELITRELGKGGLVYTSKLVKSKDEFLKALGKFTPDIILCDYKMPGFGAPEALEIIKQSSAKTPFIVVSGAIGEDVAVNLMKLGAVDYIMKDRLGRLVPAVRRALEEARIASERNKLETELKQAKEQQFRTLIENLPQKVFLKDRNSVYISCNENYAKDLKIKAEEIKGKTDYDFFPTNLAEKYRADDKRIMESGKTENLEEEYLLVADFLKKPHSFFINTVKAPVLDKAGNVTGVFGLFWDITERKRAEQIAKETREQLIQSEKLAVLGKLAGSVSHELRNPLGVIRNSIYFLKMKLGQALQDEKIKRHLDILEEEIQISDRIINDILAFARIKEVRLVETDINKIIEGFLKDIKIPENIRIVSQLNSSLPHISADEVQLGQAFSNIILNAVQAMPDGGELTIANRTNNEIIEVDIIDTGIGISKENLNKMFDPLFSTKAQGTGLGLAVCQGIIEMHRGSIEVESKIGKGTKFTVRLPIGKEEARERGQDGRKI